MYTETEEFTKQSYEEFTIATDFAVNMTTGELITSQTVTAIDVNDNNVSTVVLDQATVTNDGAQKVSVLVRAGEEANTPYKITFKCVTDQSHKWENDVIMKLKEI